MMDDRQARIANMSRTLHAAALLRQLQMRDEWYLHCDVAECEVGSVQHSWRKV